MKKQYMARIFDAGYIKDLNELNEGYPVYFNSKKEAKESIESFMLRSPKIEYGFVIKLLGGGYYRTVAKINY